MRLIVTGGGTGGHVYPALEVARLARDQGHEVFYFGSLRGQESAICKREGFVFQGFPSEPLLSLKTPRGYKAAWNIFRSRWMARAALRAAKPNALFSTGGYSAGPVVSAAQTMRLPYVIHEANSAPGRTNLLFARQAYAVAIVFPGAASHFRGCHVVRTGMPIRRELRAAAQKERKEEGGTVLVTGGSQGSAFLNERVPEAASILAQGPRGPLPFLHASGKAHFEKVRAHAAEVPNYTVTPYFEGEEMAQAYSQASLIVCRSGGSLAEVAMFGIPSVLVPLPNSAGDHQAANAQDFVSMNAATLHSQSGSTPEGLASDIEAWLDAPERRRAAKEALREFDVPDSTERILKLVLESAK